MDEKKILFSVYTRDADPAQYPAGLAQSVHLAYLDTEDSYDESTEGSSAKPSIESAGGPSGESAGTYAGTWKPLNRNYGILFAKGEISPEDTIVPMGVVRPWICDLGGGWIGIGGDKVYENGEPVYENSTPAHAFWKTRDLIHFVEADSAEFTKKSILAVDRAIAEEAIRYWSPIVCTGVELPESESMCDCAETGGDKRNAAGAKTAASSDFATFHYSDGSTAKKRLHRPTYRFPLAKGWGDPVIFAWEGRWFFLGTSDNRNCIGLYVREADDVAGLFAEGAAEHLILPYDEARGLIQTFWAPEFHVIGGEACILFAVSGHAWGPQCHLMRLKKGGRITCAEDWEDPIPVTRMDGAPLAPDGISLDMTYIKAKSGSYMVWSYRRHIGTPMDTGSMLYIAAVHENEPWRLASDPVLLTRPLLGWENVAGTINNEGPHAFARDGKIYLTYSGGSANAYTYALGLLTADSADDLTDLTAWDKSITPVLSFYSVEGEYGPGHNSFYTDDDGQLMIAYHAETALTEHLRCDAIRRVHFRRDGSPYFQMSNAQDQPQ